MLFNSINFLIFFTVITTVYYIIPFQYRCALLLAASCYFYMAFVPIYILILFFIILVDFCAAIWLENTKRRALRKLLLISSILVTCVILFIFKYFNFVSISINRLADFLGWNYSIDLLNLILPIGLSFHTFQSLSYVIEVYRGRQKPERNFGIYALYVMFYPQLVAGPIERPQNLLHQFHEQHKFEYGRVTSGLKLMLWGFFKKLVVADRLALYVNAVYGNPETHNGSSLILATLFFSVQIYCDFSGYSDIAVGAARAMGFNLMINFKRPYFSSDIFEFWRRWHISLSTWFRDYIYIPIGGKYVSIPRQALNLWIVFLVSGLWHGASWTYVVWGGLNGTYLIVAFLMKDFFEKSKRITSLTEKPVVRCLSILFVSGLICFAFSFFRANNLSDSLTIVTKMAHPQGHIFITNATQMIFCFLGIIFLFAVEWRDEYYPQFLNLFESAKAWVRLLSYSLLIMLILLTGVFDGSQFIYFQF